MSRHCDIIHFEIEPSESFIRVSRNTPDDYVQWIYWGFDTFSDLTSVSNKVCKRPEGTDLTETVIKPLRNSYWENADPNRARFLFEKTRGSLQSRILNLIREELEETDPDESVVSNVSAETWAIVYSPFKISPAEFNKQALPCDVLIAISGHHSIALLNAICQRIFEETDLYCNIRAATNQLLLFFDRDRDCR